MEFRYYECSCQGQGMVLVGNQVYLVYSQLEAFGVLERFGNSPNNGVSDKLKKQCIRELQSILSIRCNLPESEEGVVFGNGVHPEHVMIHKDLFGKLVEFQNRLVEKV